MRLSFTIRVLTGALECMVKAMSCPMHSPSIKLISVREHEAKLKENIEEKAKYDQWQYDNLAKPKKERAQILERWKEMDGK